MPSIIEKMIKFRLENCNQFKEEYGKKGILNKGVVMSKQNQSQSKNEEERKKAQASPSGSHKPKAFENQQHDDQEGYMQGLKSSSKKENQTKTGGGMDRNEGQQKPQKP